ncbi:MAG: hypothetical protein NWT00_10045 [Beijerinckiaceae bacterium]|nr:hypothetical protein [Beijerinckiaceae bacterium]
MYWPYTAIAALDETLLVDATRLGLVEHFAAATDRRPHTPFAAFDSSSRTDAFTSDRP